MVTDCRLKRGALYVVPAHCRDFKAMVYARPNVLAAERVSAGTATWCRDTREEALMPDFFQISAPLTGTCDAAEEYEAGTAPAAAGVDAPRPSVRG